MPNKPTDILNQICDKKRADLVIQKQSISINDLETTIQNQKMPRGFHQALKNKIANGQYGLIAEIKKASPSHGLIRPDFNPAQHAKGYEAGGATCLSILTDMPYFQGCADYLIEAKAACTLPVLRKDFMIDPYQVFEARAMGADCILLIMAALDDALAAELEACATSLGMDVLVETHNLEELNRALKLKSQLIGVNNRNLKTLSIDIETSIELESHIPTGYTIISESGLKTSDDLAYISKAGINGFLIGESLMKQDDVELATRKILSA